MCIMASLMILICNKDQSRKNQRYLKVIFASGNSLIIVYTEDSNFH